MKGRLPLLGPDPNALSGVSLVGRYALGVDWQDGHHSIYPFELLRAACRCPMCLGAAGAGGSAWPTAIKRDGRDLRFHWDDGHETTLRGPELRRLCPCAACAGGPDRP